MRKLGYLFHHQVGSHRTYRSPDGTRRIIVPIHAGDIKRGLLRQLIKDLGLTREEFQKLL